MSQSAKSMRAQATRTENQAYRNDDMARELISQAHQMMASWKTADERLEKWGTATTADRRLFKETMVNTANSLIIKAQEMQAESEEMRHQAQELRDQATRIECAKRVGGDEVATEYLYQLVEAGHNGSGFTEIWNSYGWYMTGTTDSGMSPDADIVIKAYETKKAKGQSAMLDYFKGLRSV